MPSTSPRPVRSLVALVLAAGALLVPAATAHAVVVTQGITGTLTGAGTGPMSGGFEIVSAAPGAKPPSIGVEYSTEDDGDFTRALAPGQYWIRFYADETWAPEWAGDAARRQDATPVTVVAGQLTTLSPELTPGGKVSGNLTDLDGGTHDGRVEVLAADNTFPGGYFVMRAGSPDGTGTFVVPGLPTGSYTVRFTSDAGQVEGWWPDQPTRATAAPVTVTAPATTSGIVQTVRSPYGQIRGTVTNGATTAPVAGATVRLWRYGVDGSLQAALYATHTGADGSYALGAPTGDYKVQVEPATTGLLPEFWNDAATSSDAPYVSVSTGTATDDIDVTLDPTAMTITARPEVIGYRRVGRTLRVTTGTWYPAGATYGYHWLRDGRTIAGAVAKTYLPTAADLGSSITATVTATRTGTATTTAASVPTVAITRGYLHLTSSATITGTTHVGRWLLAVPPRTSPSTTGTYQWLRNGTAIKGATKVRYRLTGADRGTKIGVLITRSRPGYRPVVRIVTRASPVG